MVSFAHKDGHYGRTPVYERSFTIQYSYLALGLPLILPQKGYFWAAKEVDAAPLRITEQEHSISTNAGWGVACINELLSGRTGRQQTLGGSPGRRIQDVRNPGVGAAWRVR